MTIHTTTATMHRIRTRDDRLAAAAVDTGDWLRLIADWLRLAAAPTYALMALFTGIFGERPQDLFCMAMQHASPLNGMVAMYMLMSVFHAAPWLKLIAGWAGAIRQS